MHFISFFILLVLFIIFYTIVVEIFTVLFRMTGITADKARTQVISLLTNCGFTTSESELILSSRRRRRLAQITMLCGYSFSVLIVSVLVNLFLAMNQAELRTLVLPAVLLLVFMVLTLLVMRLKPIRSRFDRVIERMGSRLLYGRNTNALILIDTYNTKAMIEVLLRHLPLFLTDVSLSQSGLKEKYDIQILSITRHAHPLKSINGDTTCKEGDTLVLFGDHKNIHTLFENPDKV